MQETASRYPSSFSWWLCALDFAIGPVWQLAVVGDPSTRGFEELAQLASATFQPRLIMAGGREGGPDGPALLQGRPMLDGRPTAYLCRAFECLLPTISPKTLSEQLREAFSPHSPS
jgi:uncharacterized protein YyaL (SSP411 family)